MKNFLIAFVFIFATAFSWPMNSYQPGDIVEDFTLQDVTGKNVSLSSFKNQKGVIVTFTCNTCPYAKLYEARIIAMQEEFAPKGYPVIAINPNDPKRQPGDSFEKMKKRASEKGYKFPYLHDVDQKIARKFGATKTPHTYVLSKKNQNFEVKYVGAIDDNPQNAEDTTIHYIRQAIDDISANKKVRIKTTKAIGCTIKWKES